MIPMLRSVYTGFERCGLGRDEDRGALMLRARERLPVNQEGNRVLRLWNAVERLAGRNTGGSAGRDARGDGAALHEPAVDVDMVRREVIAVAPVNGQDAAFRSSRRT